MLRRLEPSEHRGARRAQPKVADVQVFAPHVPSTRRHRNGRRPACPTRVVGEVATLDDDACLGDCSNRERPRPRELPRSDPVTCPVDQTHHRPLLRGLRGLAVACIHTGVDRREVGRPGGRRLRCGRTGTDYERSKNCREEEQDPHGLGDLTLSTGEPPSTHAIEVVARG